MRFRLYHRRKGHQRHGQGPRAACFAALRVCERRVIMMMGMLVCSSEKEWEKLEDWGTSQFEVQIACFEVRMLKIWGYKQTGKGFR